MDDVTDIFRTMPLPGQDSAGDDDGAEPVSLRGFANPQTLAAAQAARAANKEANTPRDLLPDGEVPTDGKKRRGRPAGGKSSRSLKGIEQLLTSIHWMLSMATGLDDLALAPDDAHALAEAGAEYASYHKIKLDGKNGALLGLVMAIGSVYGPKAVTIGIKLRAEKAARNGNGQSTGQPDPVS